MSGYEKSIILLAVRKFSKWEITVHTVILTRAVPVKNQFFLSTMEDFLTVSAILTQKFMNANPSEQSEILTKMLEGLDVPYLELVKYHCDVSQHNMDDLKSWATETQQQKSEFIVFECNLSTFMSNICA